jgi:hypothetical protein
VRWTDARSVRARSMGRVSGVGARGMDGRSRWRAIAGVDEQR